MGDVDPRGLAPRRGGLGRFFRKLALIWVVIGLVGAAGAGVLQWLGPPTAPGVAVHSAVADAEVAAPRTEADHSAEAAHPVAAHPEAAHPGVTVAAAVRPAGAPIPLPEAELQEASAHYPGAMLPVMAHGRSAMRAYAAGYDAADRRGRIALLVSGVGMSGRESEEVVRALPAAVSLAFSPYALHPEALLAAARGRGHELLLSIPMEPQNYPINDAGNHALLTRATAEADDERLEWALSRFAGYVGATGALGRLRGERFAASDKFPALMQGLGRRGLLYVDPRPGALGGGEAGVVRRAVDLVIDDPPVRVEIEARLAQLEQMAKDRGSALGLAGSTLPVTTERLAAWTATLSQRGFALVPVSALLLESAK